MILLALNIAYGCISLCLKVKKLLFSFMFLFLELLFFSRLKDDTDTPPVLVIAKDELMLLFYIDDYLISLFL